MVLSLMMEKEPLKNIIHYKTRVQKPYLVQAQNGQTLYLFMTEIAEKQYPLGPLISRWLI